MEWSEVEWGGVEWSGVEWSGVEWSGVEWTNSIKYISDNVSVSMQTAQLKYGVCAPKVCSKDNINNVLGFILKNSKYDSNSAYSTEITIFFYIVLGYA